MSLHFVFPSDPLNAKRPDETFRSQMDALNAVGLETSLISIDDRKIAPIPAAATVVYRGWMLAETEYGQLLALIEKAGGTPFTSVDAYLSCHHLPRWYSRLEGLTPETKVFSSGQPDLTTALRALGWAKFFVKDYVKSLKTSVGSVISDPAQIDVIVSEMRKYRGTIEGGICVRRFESLVPNSETRYFVLDGKAHASLAEMPIPEIASDVARRIDSPFFSIDIARHEDGRLRIIELGDGQVSDLVGWSPERFAQIWAQ
jgi:hypothetical protein